MSTLSTNLILNGGSSSRNAIYPYPTIGTPVASSTALNTPYVFNVSGNAHAFVFSPIESGDLTDFWVRVVSYTGTWALTDGVINVEVRLGFNGSNRPGLTLIGAFTIVLDGSYLGWVKKSGLAIPLVAGQLYTIVIADADGGVNFVTIARANSNQSGAFNNHGGNLTTANGFSSAASGSAATSYALKCHGVRYGGCNFTVLGTMGNNVLARGNKFKLDDPMTCIGCLIPLSFIAANWTIKIFADGVGPGGSPLLSLTKLNWTVNGATSPVHGFISFGNSNHVDLRPDTWYRIVIIPTANSAFPSKYGVGGSPDADVLAASLPFGGNFFSTVETGPSTWADDTAHVQAFTPVLVPRTSPTVTY